MCAGKQVPGHRGADGSGDGLAVNDDPILGGLCVIQAKRYSRMVGLEAVHALAGVVADKRAVKGVLVTTSWVQRGTSTIVITFAKSACGSCPVRAQRTTSASGRRQLTVHPRDVHEAPLAARAAQDTKDFQSRYALRAGVEGTIRQGVAVTGMRHARYRGLARTRLEHTNAAVALNLIRLHA